MANAGAEQYKPGTSLINCTVSDTIPDSMEGIFRVLEEAALTLKAGCGTGYEFSTLRPKGAIVSGVGASTSGPMSFADIYDAMCKTISSAGGRRGAQMMTFSICHPDIEEVIDIKREDGRLRKFNISILITKNFMEAVKNDDDWDLYFPITKKEWDKYEHWQCPKTVYKSWSNIEDNYIVNSDGYIKCKIYKTVKARYLYNKIMKSTYDWGDPGFILIDEYNAKNNNWWVETIRATNPCGEQGLPPHGACLLGSINLTHFVNAPFGLNPTFDGEKFRKVISIATRFLDNVVEINGLPLEEQRKELYRKRRHGLGITGLGSTLCMLKTKYGSEMAIKFTDRICQLMAVESYRTGIELAKEKGRAPITDELFPFSFELKNRLENRQIDSDAVELGSPHEDGMIEGSWFMAMSEYFEHFPREIVDGIIEHGCRFTHATSIAPTGTISLSLANNCSNGIEPSFSHYYQRNIIKEGKATKDMVDVYSYELLAYKEFLDMTDNPHKKVDHNIQDIIDSGLPDYFVTAHEVPPVQHIDMQAAAQKWIDSSISKTVNVPTNYPYEEFMKLYLYAYEKGLKGIAAYRHNPDGGQVGVLVKKEELAKQKYKFTLEDGTTVELNGDEDVEYDGQTHNVTNLHEALKEGQYGKF